MDRCDFLFVGRATEGEGVPRGAGDLFHSQFQGSVEPASEVRQPTSTCSAELIEAARMNRRGTAFRTGGP